MTAACAWSVALMGLDTALIEVEAAIGSGLPRTVLVGLPDTSLYEARDRCRAAVASSKLDWPAAPVTINLTPASLPKAGTHYDLSIVSAVLAAARLVPPDGARRTVALGELGLDGRVRPVAGVLPAVLAAARAGFERAVVPAGQVGEAGLVDGIQVHGVASLRDLVEVLRGRPVAPAAQGQAAEVPAGEQSTSGANLASKDLADVVGQLEARWAIEVAAAGRHHLFLHGAPGLGKTMLAERLVTILPDLEQAESLEVSAIHSLAGVGLERGLITRPPYADPHHSASLASLVGGGARIIRPGAISRSHLGVLFLDEAPEFAPRALEALRTPLECGSVLIARAEAQARFPARFQLVLAANPCPCGMAATAGADCRCQPQAIRRYSQRLSGPILDRVDIHQQLLPLRRSLLSAAPAGESSAVVAARVRLARERQRKRLAGSPWRTNSEVPGPYLRRQLPMPHGSELLDEAVNRGRLSSRGVDKVLRLSWSLADLAGRDRPGRIEVRQALALRRGESVTGGC